MNFVKKNKGVIMFYLVIAITTLIVINTNKQEQLDNDYKVVVRP